MIIRINLFITNIFILMSLIKIKVKSQFYTATFSFACYIMAAKVKQNVKSYKSLTIKYCKKM